MGTPTQAMLSDRMGEGLLGREELEDLLDRAFDTLAEIKDLLRDIEDAGVLDYGREDELAERLGGMLYTLEGEKFPYDPHGQRNRD